MRKPDEETVVTKKPKPEGRDKSTMRDMVDVAKHEVAGLGEILMSIVFSDGSWWSSFGARRTMAKCALSTASRRWILLLRAGGLTKAA